MSVNASPLKAAAPLLGSQGRRGSLLSHAPNVSNRATVTADKHGGIISTNATVFDFFGYDPSELIDTSCRQMLQLLPEKRKVLSVKPADDRFSKTDMWKDVMGDLTSVRVVNGKHKDGSLIPMLLTSSGMTLQGLQLYALLFERIPEHTAIITTDYDGIIQSATSNISTILRMQARELCGRNMSDVFPLRVGEDGMEGPSAGMLQASIDGMSGKHVVGKPVDVSCPSPLGSISARLQVIDTQHNMFVVTVRKHKTRLRGPLQEDPGPTSSGEIPLELLAADDKGTTEIGYYTVRGDLGVGQCGVVRKAVHRTTGVEVAIKTLSKTKFEEIGLRWSNRELELMKFLNHPNIVRLFDCIIGDETSYLVMEFVDGGELLAYCCEQGALPEETARSFFRDILGAVDYLHRKGIVHRDLKLENCLLDAERRVKVIDFGLANFYLKGMLKTSCGSADYAAPELFASMKYFGPPVDVWAMGVMLFAMLAGVFPFEQVQATLDGDYGWPAEIEVSESVRQLVKDIFVLNPDLRLTIEQIRRNDWVNLGFKQPPARPAISIKSNEPQQAVGVKRDVWTFRLDILIQMEHTFGFAIEAVVESLLNEDINQMTATYKMLVVKYPDEIKAVVSDPNTAVYTDAQRQASARNVIQQAHKRRERGAALDLISLRTNLRDRTQSESLDRPAAEIDEIIARRSSGSARKGTITVPPLDGIQQIPPTSGASAPTLPVSPGRGPRAESRANRSASTADTGPPGPDGRLSGSKTAREKTSIRAIFEKRFSGQKPKAQKDNEYTPDFSPSVSKKTEAVAPNMTLSPPSMRASFQHKKKNSMQSEAVGENEFFDGSSSADEAAAPAPVITGGLLGSFWKQRAKEKSASRKAQEAAAPIPGSPAVGGRQTPTLSARGTAQASQVRSASPPKYHRSQSEGVGKVKAKSADSVEVKPKGPSGASAAAPIPNTSHRGPRKSSGDKGDSDRGNNSGSE